jgi:glycerol-3-phosphate acyltransferase PlsY
MNTPEFYKILSLFGLPIFAYLLGSVPWALIITRRFTAMDIRKLGSGNIGATNVSRMAGIRLGLLTLVMDVLKGSLPVYLTVKSIGAAGLWGELYLSFVALAAVLGHLYPVYMKFKNGGKGVATGIGCFLIISPAASGIVILVFSVVAWVSKRISAGSLVAAAALPVAVWGMNRSIVSAGCALTIAVFIWIRHKDNIQRLLSGNEPPFRQKPYR